MRCSWYVAHIPHSVPQIYINMTPVLHVKPDVRSPFDLLRMLMVDLLIRWRRYDRHLPLSTTRMDDTARTPGQVRGRRAKRTPRERGDRLFEWSRWDVRLLFLYHWRRWRTGHICISSQSVRNQVQKWSSLARYRPPRRSRVIRHRWSPNSRKWKRRTEVYLLIGLPSEWKCKVEYRVCRSRAVYTKLL